MAAKKKAKGSKGGKGAAKKAAAAKPSPEASSPSPAQAGANGAATEAAVSPEMRKGEERARYKKKLPVDSTDEEKVIAGGELAKLVDAIEAFKIEKRQILAELKERRTGIEQNMNELAGVYKGKKLVDVEVVEMLYVESVSIDTVRVDTGEVVETRAATKEDLQRVLDETLADKTISKMMGGPSAVARLDAAIAKTVAEQLAPKPGALRGPGETGLRVNGDDPLADEDDEDEDDDDADGPIGGDDEDDPLGLGN